VLCVQRVGTLAQGLGKGYIRGAPNHPQIQEKNEIWHKTLKSCLLLEHYHLSGDLEQSVGGVCGLLQTPVLSRKSKHNVTTADFHLARGESIL